MQIIVEAVGHGKHALSVDVGNVRGCQVNYVTSEHQSEVDHKLVKVDLAQKYDILFVLLILLA